MNLLERYLHYISDRQRKHVIRVTTVKTEKAISHCVFYRKKKNESKKK